jgi:hypothetical protein
MSPFMPKNYLQAQRHYYWKKKGANMLKVTNWSTSKSI